MTDYRPAGIEGLVVKAADSKYTPGRRTWIKVKSRETTEVLIGGVTGSLERPDTIVAGLVRDGELHVVGRSTPLTTTQSKALGEALTPAGPDHPWPDVISSTPVRRIPRQGPARQGRAADRGGSVGRQRSTGWRLPASPSLRATSVRPHAGIWPRQDVFIAVSKEGLELSRRWD